MHESTATAANTMMPAMSTTGLLVDGIGILVGLFAVVLVIKTLGKIGGQVGSAFRLTLLGVLSQLFALLYNILVEEFHLLTVPGLPFGIESHRIHDIFMLLGMLFFVLAAQRFSKLSS